MSVFKESISKYTWSFWTEISWHSRVPNPARILFLVLLTAFLGELKMNPFGHYFQFSLGTACFFFGLIWFCQISSIGIGIVTGIGIFCFRIIISHFLIEIPLQKVWIIYFPAIFFYIVFALVIELLHVRQKTERLLFVAFAGVAAEILANCTELAIRDLFHQDYVFNVKTVMVIALFGILRSFFVVGIYHMIIARQDQINREHQQKRIDNLLLVNSSLYKEAVFLKKSMENIESATRQSYELYRCLQSTQTSQELSSHALHLAQQIHELKKDSQRILAGLSKIMKTDGLNLNMTVGSLLKLVARTNQNYADMLDKSIEFYVKCDIDLETDQLYTLLSIFNNLVTNSVEAIQTQGKIGMQVRLVSENVLFSIWNTGPEIHEKDRNWIFQMGYTTKFDQAGNASTGIGLPHALDLVTSLGGSLQLQSNADRTEFLIKIPMNSMKQGGQKI